MKCLLSGVAREDDRDARDLAGEAAAEDICLRVSSVFAVDTAAVYHNEEAIGIALKDLLPRYELTREDIFITTKLSPQDLPEPRLRAAVNKSLTLLGVSYLDLYLIHWPGAQGK
ncbi:hypothetical protein J6590_012462 [Homalodisca vitripennis]|nr:hypothetical protein J6590_012462 [Homalodisca vitripennis]